MGKARTLKAEFFQDDRTAPLTPEARLFLLGAATLSDRNGVLENRPLRVKTASMPYDPVNPDEVISSLVGTGMLMVSECRNFLKITLFHEWFQAWNKEQEYDISQVVFVNKPVEPTVATHKLPGSYPVATCKLRGKGQGKGQGKEETKETLAMVIDSMQPLLGDIDAKDFFWGVLKNWTPDKYRKPLLSALAMRDALKAGVEPMRIWDAAAEYGDAIEDKKYMIQVPTWLANEGWESHATQQ